MAETLGKVSLENDVVNSFKFYIMLSVFLGSHGISESKASRALYEYIHMLKQCDKCFEDPELIATYMQAAYCKLPAEFLKLYDIPSNLGDGIRIVDSSYTWIQ